MSALLIRDREGHRIGTLSAGRVARWLTIVGSCAMVAAQVVAVDRAGPRWPALLLVLLAVASANLPDGGVPLATIGFAAGWWLVAVPSPAAGPATVVALALLVFHVATTHAATGPAGRDVAGRVVLAALGRTAAVGLGTLAVGLGAATTTGRVDVPALVLALALAAVAALAVATTRQ